MNRLLLSLVFLLAWVAGECGAQQVRVEGDVDHRSVTTLREILGRNRYHVVARDTVLGAESVIDSDLVVAGAVVRLEGRVNGALVVLPGAELFVRPGAVITGPTLELRSGVYLSQRATVGERLTLPAEVGATLSRNGSDYHLRLTPPAAPSVVRSTGLFGVGAPTYDRVDGLTVRAGARLRLSPDSAASIIAASVLYHVARERFGGVVRWRIPVDARTQFVAEVARSTETNDRWIRGDLANSLAAFFVRSDARDYHEADLAFAEISRAHPPQQVVSTIYLAPRLRIGASRARSLSESDPRALFGSDWRDNPPIDPGTIGSGTAGTGVAWRGVTASFRGDAALEWAPPGVGDFDFRMLTLDGRWTMLALAGHTIAVRGHMLHPLGTSAPRQRWAILGGPGTLPTLESGELRGDHLAFIESTYSIPLPFITLPLIGTPSLVGRHAIGSAWTATTGRPPLDQNLGLGIAFPLVSLMVDTEPSDVSRPVVTVAVSLPL